MPEVSMMDTRQILWLWRAECRIVGLIGFFVALFAIAVARPNVALADFDDGVAAFQRGDYAEAVAEWEPLAAQNNASALFNLAQMYRRGLGVAAEPALAERYYRQAALLGHVAAQANLGSLYFTKKPAQPKEAIYFWRQAARQGDAVSQYQLGVQYFNGEFVVRDRVEGYAWMVLAADKGLADAKRALGEMRTFLSSEELEQGVKLALEIQKGTQQAGNSSNGSIRSIPSVPQQAAVAPGPSTPPPSKPAPRVERAPAPVATQKVQAAPAPPPPPPVTPPQPAAPVAPTPSPEPKIVKPQLAKREPLPAKQTPTIPVPASAPSEPPPAPIERPKEAMVAAKPAPAPPVVKAKPIPVIPAPPQQAPAPVIQPTRPIPVEIDRVPDRWRVQIAARRSEADAQDALDKAIARHVALLSAVSGEIYRADLGEKGVFYRAQFSPFADRTDAAALCQKLSSAGTECFVARAPGS